MVFVSGAFHNNDGTKSGGEGEHSGECPQVLAVGFPPSVVEEILEEFGARGYNVVTASNAEQAETLFVTIYFDVTMIDVEHIDVFAPHLIHALRQSTGPSRTTEIIAIDKFAFAELKSQLMRSGGNQIVPDWREVLVELGS